MAEPKRIQLRRIKGWRKPEGTIVVARPTVWGNPWREGTATWTVRPDRTIDRSGKVLTRQDAVDSYCNSLTTDPDQVEAVRRELAGHDLACWCKPGDPCHADVLLEIANSESEPAPVLGQGGTG